MNNKKFIKLTVVLYLIAGILLYFVIGNVTSIEKEDVSAKIVHKSYITEKGTTTRMWNGKFYYNITSTEDEKFITILNHNDNIYEVDSKDVYFTKDDYLECVILYEYIFDSLINTKFIPNATSEDNLISSFDIIFFIYIALLMTGIIIIYVELWVDKEIKEDKDPSGMTIKLWE